MFYENIRRMDHAVGEILGALESAGLADSTLVVFTTDHGMAFPRAKATLYDPGIRTTLLMRWPEGMTGGQCLSPMTSNVDLFATLVHVTRGSPPVGTNGQSLLPLVRGDRYEHRDAVFAEKNTSADDLKRCIRTATHKYIVNYSEGPQLLLPTDIEVTASRRDMGDEHLTPRLPVELYDLESDPWEQVNVAGAPEYGEIQRELAARLQSMLEDTQDPVLRGAIPRSAKEAEIHRRIWGADAMRQRADREAEIHRAYGQMRKEHE